VDDYYVDRLTTREGSRAGREYLVNEAKRWSYMVSYLLAAPDFASPSGGAPVGDQPYRWWYHLNSAVHLSYIDHSFIWTSKI